jgi:hypothetical protein
MFLSVLGISMQYDSRTVCQKFLLVLILLDVCEANTQLRVYERL